MSTGPNSSARILDAALSLFSAKGYEATSTREICGLAGITKPTLYYFYKSKEGIYRALIREAMNKFESVVETGLSSSGSLRERYKKVAELMFADLNRRPQGGRLIFQLVWSANTPFADDVHKSHVHVVKRMSQAAASAVKAGEISGSDQDTRMLVLMGAIGEAVAGFLIMGHPKLTKKLAHSIIDTVLDGWQAPGTRVPR
jgi:TetR/AcrR family transcriptional regulator